MPTRTASLSRFGFAPPQGGAAQASGARSWRDFLNQRRASSIVPDLTGRQGGGWSTALEPPRPEPGSDEDILHRAETRQASREDLAAALGAPGPAGGEPPDGLLSTALDIINRPHSMVTGAVSGALGYTEGDEFDDAGILQSTVGRAAAGLAGDEQYRVGDMVRDSFGVEDDTPFVGRAAASTAGFLGDVALDPLTYVSLGGSVVGKRIAGEAVERQVAHRAQDVLSRQARREWGERAPRMAAPRAAREAAPDESVLARQADDALARADAPPDTWRGTREEWLEHLGDRQFSGAAAEAFQAGGPTGLRRFLKTELGDEAGERLFRELPRDVQGGLRIRQPFSRDPQTGTARAVGVGGGGRWLEQFGLDDAAMTAHQWRNRVRARGVGRYIADNMTGRDGALYGRMVESVYDRPGDFSGVAYRQMQAVKDAKREAEQYGRQIHQATQDAYGRVRVTLKDSGDEDAARDAMRRWAMDPASLDEYRAGGVEFPDVGSARGPGLDDLDEAERAGITAAMHFHDFLRHRLQDMRAAGLSVDELNDYIPRIRTMQERELRQARKPVRQSIGMRGGEGAYDPRRTRRQYVEAFTVEGDDGLPRVEFRHLTPEEANRASGRAVFEEDPLEILAAYGDAARRLSTRTRLANLLRESGQIVEGSMQYERILAGRHVEDMVSTAQRTLDEHEVALQDAARRARTDVDAAQADVEQARARAQRAREAADDADERLRRVREGEAPADTLADDSPLRYPRREYVSDQARRRVAEAEAEVDERLARQRREYAEARLADERQRRAAQEMMPLVEHGDDFLSAALQGRSVIRPIDDVEARWFADPDSERVLIDAGWERAVYAADEMPDDVATEALIEEVGERAARDAIAAAPQRPVAERLEDFWRGYVPFVEVWRPASREVGDESVRVAWQHLRRIGDSLSDDEYVGLAGDVFDQLRVAANNADPDVAGRGELYRFHEPAAVIGEQLSAGVANPALQQRRLGAIARVADELADMGWGLRYRTAYSSGTGGDVSRRGGWRMSLDRRRTSGHEVHASRQATRDWMQRLGFTDAELPDPPRMRVSFDRRGQKQAAAVDELTDAQFRWDASGRRREAMLASRDDLDDAARQLQRRLDADDLAGHNRKTVEAALRRLRREVDAFDESYRNLSPRPDGVHVERGLREAAPEPRLTDFLGEAPAQPGLGRAERDRMRRRLEAEARREWDEALRGARREGAQIPEEIVESAPRSVRERAEQARRGALQPAVRRAQRDMRDADRGLQRELRRLEGAESRAQRAESELAQIEREIDQIASDRRRLAETTGHVMGLEDPNERFEALDTLVDGLIDFHERAYDRYGAEMSRMVDASREALREARRETRQRIRTIMREAEQARAGRLELDEVGQHYLEVGLHQIGGPRVTGPRAGRSPEDLVMPPELDVSFAPEVMRDAVEKFFRASRPGTSDHFAAFLDGVYRPYFQLFKATATIMRGPGYVTRNTIGGIWNNYVRDVTARDHRLSAQIMRGRRQAWSDAMDEFAEQMARQRGRPVDEVRRELPPDRVAARAEQLLEERLSPITVGDTNLFQVHRAMQMEEVGWTDNRIFESIHGMLQRQFDADTAQFWQADPRQPFQSVDPPAQMFRHLGESELNMVQRGANRVVNNWWADVSKDWARQSEDFIRGAAFIRGVQEYGLDDGGRTAALLSRALHFDYQDLSHFEDTWMRGTLVPFYVWSRHNVPLQVRALFKDPGKMHRLGLARDEMEALMGDDEFDMVPEWMRERLGFATRYRFGGSPIIVGMETPAYDLNQFIKIGSPGEAARSTMRHLTSQVSPVFQLPVEQMLGVSTFTGAAFNPRGTEAPLWYRAIPGLPTRVDEQGTVRGHAPTISAVRDAIPPLGQLERIAPTTDQYRERWPTSLVSTLAAWPTATFTPRQQAGELRARSDRLDSAATWAADQAVVDEARELLEQGLPPEQVRRVLEARHGR